MAETGRLVVMRGSEIAIREYPVVGPATGAMLVRQELSGICGTDVHNWKHQRMQDWTPLGHENVGMIIEVLEVGIASRGSDRTAIGPVRLVDDVEHRSS